MGINKSSVNKTKVASEEFSNCTTSDEKSKEVEMVFDTVYDDISACKEWEYLNENVMKKVYMDAVTKRKQGWTKTQNCIYPNCNNISIKKSHSIQRATSIKYISEKGYVLTPNLQQTPDKLEHYMKPIGINDASTFPGYCKEHERIFEGFEKDGIFKVENDYKLQVYRTICREIVFRKHHLNWLENTFNSYMKQVESVFVSEMKKRIGNTIQGIEITSIKINREDNFKKLHEDSVYRMKNTLLELEELHKAHFKDNIIHFCTKIPFQVPVAISGISYATLVNENKNIGEDGIVIMNCLPFDKYTYIIISSLACYSDSISKIFEYRTQTPLLLLNFIESFMVYGTEHWFIKESVWNNLDDKRKRQILNDIVYSEWNILTDYQYSIFDEIRKQLICEGEDIISESKVPQAYIEHMNIEKIKLQKMPQEVSENTVDLAIKAAKLRVNKIDELIKRQQK